MRKRRRERRIKEEEEAVEKIEEKKVLNREERVSLVVIELVPEPETVQRRDSPPGSGVTAKQLEGRGKN